jgi:hypothetical protein
MPKEVFTDFKRVRKILDKTKRHPREEKLEIKNKSHTIESPNIQKVCSECNEKKPIYLFNVSESGKRHKPYCKKCETLLNNPKKQGKVVKKGEVKEQKVSMVELRAEIRRNEDIQKKAKKERKKNKIKQKEKGEIMEAKKTNKNIFTATDYFIHTILPYIIKTKNCFTIRQIKPEFKLKINGTKEHGAVYRVLEELVNLEYLHVRKEGGGKANRYYIPRKEIGNLIREGHLTKEQTALVQPIWEEADKEEKKEKVEDKVDSISRVVEALEKKNEEKRREETGDELILKGLIKILQDVKDSRNQFEINITNEKRTGFLGHTIETGREIATIKYHKPGKGVLNIKKLEGE